MPWTSGGVGTEKQVSDVWYSIQLTDTTVPPNKGFLCRAIPLSAEPSNYRVDHDGTARPVLGGGFMTALAVPLIDRIGLPAFTMATAAITGALIGWGKKRGGHGRRVLRPSS